MKFHYKNALKTHLVREHNQEREFECSICGTQFMHKKNYTRIVDLLAGPRRLIGVRGRQAILAVYDQYDDPW